MKEIRKKILLSAVLALFTMFFLTNKIFLRFPLLMGPSSVLCLPITASIAFLYLKAFFPFEKRRFLLSFTTGLMMSLMFILGIRYSSNEVPTPTIFSFLAALLAAGLLFSAFVSLLFEILPFTVYLKGSNEADKIRQPGIKVWIGLFVITLLVYGMAFLAVYPGLYSYDASNQIQQFFGDVPVTDRHPILHTLFLCKSLKLGEILFHSYHAGLAIYSLLQISFMAFVITLVLGRMIRRNAPFWLIGISWLFLAANPYMQILSLLTTKDILFGALFLLSFDFSIDMVSDPERFYSSPGLQAVFFLSVLFACFFRKQGIYVFLFFAFFVLLYFISYKKNRRLRRLIPRWSLCAVTFSFFFLTVNGPILTALGVEKGDAKEMLCVPMQQLTRVWHEKPESLTTDEKAYIEELILPDALENYIPVNADPVKSGFQTEVVKENLSKFLSSWMRIGLKEPLVYLDSFLMGNWGYWYPGQTQYWINYILYDGAFMEEEYNVLHIFRNSKFPLYDEFLRKISLTPQYEKIPLLSLVLNQAFPFWLMLLTGTVLVYRKKMRYLVPLAWIFGYWGTLLLGPVTCVRYAFPLMLCVPLMTELLLFGTAGRERGQRNQS